MHGCEPGGTRPALRAELLARASPVDDYLRKGGRLEETEGRTCLGNGLLATAGLAQRRVSGPEPAIVTAGAWLLEISRLLGDRDSYSAADVVAYLTGRY